MAFYSFTYTVNSVKGNPEREQHAQKIHDYMGKITTPLGTPTISLTNKKECWEWLEANPDFNIDLVGYNPGHYSKSQVIKKFSKRDGWKYGEIGVWASNFLAWKAFVNAPQDCLILFEDDLIIQDDFMQTLHTYMDELPEDWEVFYFFVDPSTHVFYKPNEHHINKDHVCTVYQDWSNACYVINKKAASKLYSEIQVKPIDLPVDWHILKRLDVFNVYTVLPTAYMPCSLVPYIRSSFQSSQKRWDLSKPYGEWGVDDEGIPHSPLAYVNLLEKQYEKND